jgi:hypothetical protein
LEVPPNQGAWFMPSCLRKNITPICISAKHFGGIYKTAGHFRQTLCTTQTGVLAWCPRQMNNAPSRFSECALSLFLHVHTAFLVLLLKLYPAALCPYLPPRSPESSQSGARVWNSLAKTHTSLSGGHAIYGMYFCTTRHYPRIMRWDDDPRRSTLLILSFASGL